MCSLDMKPGNTEVDGVQDAQRYLDQQEKIFANALKKAAEKAALEGRILTNQEIDALPGLNLRGCSYTFAGTYENQLRAQKTLSIADHFIRAGTYTHVLIACSEILSKRIDGSYDGRNLAILLGDGAAAAVIGPANDPDTGILSTILHANGAGAKALYTAAPGSASGKMCTITKDDIDAGRIHFRMDGKTVFDNGVACMSSVIQECLRANHLTIHDIDLLIPHQANLRMLETLAEKLALPPEKLFVNIQEYGNTGSASLPIALDQARKQQRAKPGDLVMLVGFGSGFAWASALIRL